MILEVDRWEPSSTWWLKSVTEKQYREIYSGTEAMGLIHLFRTPPTSDADYFANYFPSKLFRMCAGIYKIENKQGKKVGFEFNWAQHNVYAAYLNHPRLIILKSRQQGISTMWLMMFIDTTLTMAGSHIGLMSQGKSESRTLFERITVALEGIEPKIVRLLGVAVVKNNSEQISFSNKSMMYIQTSFRSGTLQGLHISEMGKISAKYPEKARETKSGSLQAIAAGLPVIVESTAEGRRNEFYNMWYTASDYVGNRTPFDFYPVFLSWTDDPDCSMDIPQMITAEAEEYFIQTEAKLSEMKGNDVRLTKQQKWWWIAKKREIDSDEKSGDMWQEYPAYSDEAFASVRDGTYYARLYRTHVKDGGREVEDLYDPNLAVYAACDLGKNDMWVTIYFQVFNNLDGKLEFRIVGEFHDTGSDTDIEYYVDAAKREKWKIEKWFLPHDAKVSDLSQKKTRAAIFRTLGCKVRVLSRPTSRENDIGIVRDAMKNMWFDLNTAKYITEACYNYTKKWDKNLGTWSDGHLHDEWSNPADAMRYMVMAFRGKVKAANDESPSRRRAKTGKRRGGSVAV